MVLNENGDYHITDCLTSQYSKVDPRIREETAGENNIVRASWVHSGDSLLEGEAWPNDEANNLDNS